MVSIQLGDYVSVKRWRSYDNRYLRPYLGWVSALDGDWAAIRCESVLRHHLHWVRIERLERV